MFAFLSLFTLGLALTAPADSLAMPVGCEALFQPVKNGGAKTERGPVSNLASSLESHSVAKLLTDIQSNGIDVSHLTLRITSGNRASAELLFKGEVIGSGELQDRRRGVHPGAIYVREIQVTYSYSARGLGTLLYLVLAREAQKMSLQLESSWDPTPNDKATWSGMVRRGWARQVDSLFSEMDPRFMEDATTKSSIDLITQNLR